MEINKLFWLLWTIFFGLLIAFLISQITIDRIFFLFILSLIGIAFYHQMERVKSLKKISKTIESFDLRPIENEIRKIGEHQTENLLKVFELEMNSEKYKMEQEKKYRDVVKKILELDNKLNEKFELLGKVMLKLSKDLKKS